MPRGRSNKPRQSPQKNQKSTKGKKTVKVVVNAPANRKNKQLTQVSYAQPGAKVVRRRADLSHVAEFLENMMNPSKPYLIPRMVPTEAVPNHYTSVRTLEINKTDGFGALMIQPSLLAPIQQLVRTSEGVEYDSHNRYSSYHHLPNPAVNVYSVVFDYDNPLMAINSGETIKPFSIKDGFHYGENLGLLESGGKAYHGVPTNLANGSMSIAVKNNNSYVINARMGFQWVQGVNRVGNVYWGNETIIQPSQAARCPSGDGAANPIPPNSEADGFCLMLSYMTTVNTNIWGGTSLDLQVVAGPFVGETWVWKNVPFFPLSSGEYNDVITNYMRAQFISTTGFSCLLQNTAPTIQAGGTISACRLAGATRNEVPMIPEELFQYASNKNTMDRLRNAKLKDGAFWSYHPEKIQDLMFREHSDPTNEWLYGDSNLPYLLVAFKWETPESAPNLTAMLDINVEYITNSIVAPKKKSPMDSSRLMELWIGFGSEINHVTENPVHLRDIKQWAGDIVKKTLRNPEFYKAAGSLAAKYGPVVAAALL